MYFMLYYAYKMNLIQTVLFRIVQIISFEKYNFVLNYFVSFLNYF
nr:MAG TPA: hypothetical protein [Caudoviricetes sp.]